MNEATVRVIYDALRFSVWAAGEGICPIAEEPLDPETFLYEFSLMTGDEDWGTLPERIRAALAQEDGG